MDFRAVFILILLYLQTVYTVTIDETKMSSQTPSAIKTSGQISIESFLKVKRLRLLLKEIASKSQEDEKFKRKTKNESLIKIMKIFVGLGKPRHIFIGK
jgi:hypothetical protein